MLQKMTNSKEILSDLLSMSEKLSSGHHLYQEFLLKKELALQENSIKDDTFIQDAAA